MRAGESKASSKEVARNGARSDETSASTSPTSHCRKPRSGHQTMAIPPVSRLSALSNAAMGSRIATPILEHAIGQRVHLKDGLLAHSALDQHAA